MKAHLVAESTQQALFKAVGGVEAQRVTLHGGNFEELELNRQQIKFANRQKTGAVSTPRDNGLNFDVDKESRKRSFLSFTVVVVADLLSESLQTSDRLLRDKI